MPKVRALTSARITTSQLFGTSESSTAAPAISQRGPSVPEEPSTLSVASASSGVSAQVDTPSPSARASRPQSLSKAARSTARSSASDEAAPTALERASRIRGGTLSPQATARTARARAENESLSPARISAASVAVSKRSLRRRPLRSRAFRSAIPEKGL